jgi:hypothetical protein
MCRIPEAPDADADGRAMKPRFQFRLRRIPWWTCIKVGTVMGSVFAIGGRLLGDFAGVHRAKSIQLHGWESIGVGLMIYIPFCFVIAIFVFIRGDD